MAKPNDIEARISNHGPLQAIAIHGPAIKTKVIILFLATLVLTAGALSSPSPTWGASQVDSGPSLKLGAHVPELDLIFTIDTTSSMGDDINAVKAAATDLPP